MGVDKEIIYSLPIVDLHQVNHGQQQYLAQGPFTITLEHHGEQQKMMAEVPGYRWEVATHLAALKSNEYTYIFAVEGHPEFFFCILVAPDTPVDILAGLDEFLKAVTAYTAIPHGPEPIPATVVPTAAPVQQPAPGQHVTMLPATGPPATKTQRVVSGIQSGSAIVALGVLKAAELAAKGIEHGANMAIQRTKPVENPTAISASTKANLERAKTVSSAAATMTKTMAAGVGSMVGTVASHIVKTVSSDTKPGKHQKRPSSIKEVSCAGVLAISDLVDTMAAAALTVVGASNSAAARVVEHKYGKEVGAASRDGLDAAKHMLEAALAMRQLKTKAILKACAKQTVVGLVQAPTFPGGPAPAGASAAGTSVAGGSAGAAARPVYLPQVPGAQVVTAPVPAGFTLPEPSMVNGVPVGGQVAQAPAHGQYPPAHGQYPPAHGQYPTHIPAAGGVAMYPAPQ